MGGEDGRLSGKRGEEGLNADVQVVLAEVVGSSQSLKRKSKSTMESNRMVLTEAAGSAGSSQPKKPNTKCWKEEPRIQMPLLVRCNQHPQTGRMEPRIRELPEKLPEKGVESTFISKDVAASQSAWPMNEVQLISEAKALKQQVGVITSKVKYYSSGQNMCTIHPRDCTEQCVSKLVEQNNLSEEAAEGLQVVETTLNSKVVAASRSALPMNEVELLSEGKVLKQEVGVIISKINSSGQKMCTIHSSDCTELVEGGGKIIKDYTTPELLADHVKRVGEDKRFEETIKILIVVREELMQVVELMGAMGELEPVDLAELVDSVEEMKDRCSELLHESLNIMKSWEFDPPK